MSNVDGNLPPSLNRQEDEPRESSKSVMLMIRRGLDSLGKSLVSLFREDPEITALLTDELKRNFKTEFERMYRERREDVQGESSVRQRCHVRQWDVPKRVFEALVRDFPEIDQLGEHKANSARKILRSYCNVGEL